MSIFLQVSPTHETRFSDQQTLSPFSTRPNPTYGKNSKSVPHVDAIVVGAGWAGLWLLNRLRQKNLSCLLLEAHGEVGGVWATTKYPGCRNETETPVYQFSAKETWSSWKWCERFPARHDVQAYMSHVSKILNLAPDIVLNARISQASWVESSQHWKIQVEGEDFATAQFFLPCTGYANLKWIPSIPGLKSFAHAYHTSEWPEGLDLDGKRVGVIGTGSSGSQVIETIGPRVGHLTVFQRNPNFAIPRIQESLTTKSEMKEQQNYGERYARMQNTPTGLEMEPIDRPTFQDDKETRQKIYEELWTKGAQHFWFGNYKDLLTDRAANREAYVFWRDKTRSRIDDDRMRDILAPHEPPYAFGTKRPSLESSYFEVYNQPNVDLVDLKTDNIREVKSNSVQMQSGEAYDLDVIVLATGYDFGIGSLIAIDIRGRDGMSLREKWGVDDGVSKEVSSSDGGVKTHLGIACAGFPNMLLCCGPQAPTAFGITPRIAELQGDWIVDLVAHTKCRGSIVDTTAEAENLWKKKTEAAVRNTLIPGTDGWYMGNNIPGRRKEPLFWFGGVPEYMRCCYESAERGYEGFTFQ